METYIRREQQNDEAVKSPDACNGTRLRCTDIRSPAAILTRTVSFKTNHPAELFRFAWS